MNAQTTTRDQWKLHKMPKPYVTLPIDRTFSAREMEKIKLGFRPRDMEDRWFIFCEKDCLYIHRSWTGYCIYVVRLRECDNGFIAWELRANRNPKQYGVSDDLYDAQMVFWVIDFILLGRDA